MRIYCLPYALYSLYIYICTYHIWLTNDLTFRNCGDCCVNANESWSFVRTREVHCCHRPMAQRTLDRRAEQAVPHLQLERHCAMERKWLAARLDTKTDRIFFQFNCGLFTVVYFEFIYSEKMVTARVHDCSDGKGYLAWFVAATYCMLLDRPMSSNNPMSIHEHLLYLLPTWDCGAQKFTNQTFQEFW